MTAPVSNRLDYVGSVGASTQVPVATIRAPTSSDIRGPSGQFKIGQIWVDTVTNTSYILASFNSHGGQVQAFWTSFGSIVVGPLTSLTPDTGSPISGGGNNINVVGVANQLLVAGSFSAGELQISMDLPLTEFPGNLTSGAAMEVFGGNIFVQSGEGIFADGIGLTGPDNRFDANISHPPTCFCGISPSFGGLSGVTVPNTNVTANSIILCGMVGSGAPFGVAATLINPGVEFEIGVGGVSFNSAAYMIIN